MSLKSQSQFSFVDALMPVRSSPHRLEKISEVVKWYRFEKVLRPVSPEAAVGRPGYPALVLFKALLLQALYGLSDAELEEALYDRLSFRRFAGLSLDQTVPDHTTLCRFRGRLIEAGLLDRLFLELDRQLDGAGLILRRGTMLDATVIETTAARPPRTEAGTQVEADAQAKTDAQNAGPDSGSAAGTAVGRAAAKRTARPPSDPDARFTRRKGRSGSAYGYKAHVGVDEGSGLIRRVTTTPASVNDTVPADRLICGDEARVLADSAYHTHARERELKARGIKCGLMRRANKHHRQLKPSFKRFNKLISRRRAAVETTFATFKRRMGLTRIRYRGLVKAAAQILLAAMAFNMRRWVTLAT